jgi:DNA polymerase III sliding clamp (beta) subunit (PCNA family)
MKTESIYKRLELCSSTDDYRTNLFNKIHFNKERKCLVSTDGHRMLIEKTEDTNFPETFIADIAVKHNQIVESLDKEFPDYFNVVPNFNNYIFVKNITIPEWLSKFTKVPKSPIRGFINTKTGDVSITQPENKDDFAGINLALIAPFAGEIRKLFVSNIEPELNPLIFTLDETSNNPESFLDFFSTFILMPMRI